tara:strand:- start:2459 stop:4234 length:1776 start_codon:yes stop_codon:yes gene_type:complete
MSGWGGWGASNAMAQASSAPPLKFFELRGLFRFRGDINHNMALGVGPRQEVNGAGYRRPKYFNFPYPYPVSSYPLFNSSLINGDNYERTMASANMRLRLHANFNISENAKIFTTFDVLDNLVLGSTPRGNTGILQDPFTPLVGLSTTQLPPSNGVNAFMDSVRVRHLWAQVTTPFGLLRVGRMPSHWGLGILANKGMDMTSENPRQVNTDSDYGDTVDRVMFITRVLGHIIIPFVDIVSSGPTYTAQNELALSQAFDPSIRDDGRQFGLAIAKVIRPYTKMMDQLDDGRNVFNYGLYFIVRQQELTSECDPNSTCKSEELGTAINNFGRDPSFINLEKRGALLFIPDVWLQVLISSIPDVQLRIELEAVAIAGSIDRAPNQKGMDIFQWGGALEFEARLLNSQLWLGLNFGIASGDRDFFSRWGFNADTDGSKNSSGNCRAGTDADGTCRGAINNFTFDPDYQIDMILWREMYGTFTNAWYTKAHITYNIGNPWEKEDGLGFRLAAIYSQALDEAATLGKALPLGLEFNLSFRFANAADNYFLDFSYGILIPLPGLAYAAYTDSEARTGRTELQALQGTAHRFWVRLGLRF